MSAWLGNISRGFVSYMDEHCFGGIQAYAEDRRNGWKFNSIRENIMKKIWTRPEFKELSLASEVTRYASAEV